MPRANRPPKLEPDGWSSGWDLPKGKWNDLLTDSLSLIEPCTHDPQLKRYVLDGQPVRISLEDEPCCKAKEVCLAIREVVRTARCSYELVDSHPTKAMINADLKPFRKACKDALGTYEALSEYTHDELCGTLESAHEIENAKQFPEVIHVMMALTDRLQQGPQGIRKDFAVPWLTHQLKVIFDAYNECEPLEHTGHIPKENAYEFIGKVLALADFSELTNETIRGHLKLPCPQ